MKRELKTLKSQRGTIGHFTSVIHTIRPREEGGGSTALFGHTIHAVEADPNTDLPIAGYRLNVNGDTQHAEGNDGAALSFISYSGEWLITGSPNDFEVQFGEGGTSGAAGTTNPAPGTGWHDLAGNAVITLTKNALTNGQANQVLNVVVREKLDVGNTSSATITLQAEYIV